MFNKRKMNEVSIVKQNEDKYARVDYNKAKVDIGSGIRGNKDKIMDCR
jgi:hypothetical protein